jgi:protein ImuB
VREGSRRLVAAADHVAQAAGLTAGMTVALAQAMVPGLSVVEADPTGDAAGLERLAAWCLRYSPVAAPDPLDGIVIDVAGAAHLHGGETALVADILARLAAAGFAARAALADTWAAAWGLARFAPSGTISPQGESFAALEPLPVAALRLDPETVSRLRRLGFDTVFELTAAHRPSLALRFGPALTHRLDQARGAAGDPIEPIRAPEIPHTRLAFTDPLMHAGGLRIALTKLADALCADLDDTALAARRLDLVFHRVDGATAALRVGASQGTRDPAHIVRLFGERLDTIDPGFGIEAASLAATRTEPFTARQFTLRDRAEEVEPELGPLVDRIANRIGARRLYRVVPVESDIPERTERRVAALSPAHCLSWSEGPRPALVLTPPEPVEVVALLPDHPPRFFIWRGRRTAIARADGPERVHGEWWRADDEIWLTRDYFRVEGTDGLRYWLFRAGDGTADMRWYIQGAFG